MSVIQNNKCERTPLQSNKSGFTLIEEIIIFWLVALMSLGAVIVQRHCDKKLAWLLGCLIGLLTALLMLAMVLAIFNLLRFVTRGTPTYPYCMNDKCHHKSDYDIIACKDDCVWVCRCGDRYYRRGRRFMYVTDKGEKMQYMIWMPFRGWVPDK